MLYRVGCCVATAEGAWELVTLPAMRQESKRRSVQSRMPFQAWEEVAVVVLDNPSYTRCASRT
jgi:hypothetical protein